MVGRLGVGEFGKWKSRIEDIVVFRRGVIKIRIMVVVVGVEGSR